MAGPADHREFRHGRSAGARDDEMCFGHPAADRQRTARFPPRRRGARRFRERASSSSPRACCTITSRSRASAGSASIAGGTISDMTRAPCEPPMTRSQKPARRQSRILQARRVEHGRANRIAGLDAFRVYSFGSRRPSVWKTRGNASHAPRKQPIGAAEHRILLVQKSGCRASLRRAAAARSDSRQSRRRTRGLMRRNRARASVVPPMSVRTAQTRWENIAAGRGGRADDMHASAGKSPPYRVARSSVTR